MKIFIADQFFTKSISFSKITPDKEIYVEFSCGNFNEHEHIIFTPEEIIRIIASISDCNKKLCFQISL